MTEVGTMSDRERLVSVVRAWIAGDPDEATRAELEALLARDAYAELSERFTGPLVFGTAGLRGVVGAGLGRMNRAVVIRATRGVADYLIARGLRNLPVVVGYDARIDSVRFAADAAGVLRAAGFVVRVFEREVPTPLVAYAARVLGAGAALMITASHNPRDYNGYKVYLEGGVQLVPPIDARIARAIDAVGPANVVPRVEIAAEPAAIAGACEPVPAGLFERYLAELAPSLPPGSDAELRIAYTPLHGVGLRFALAALAHFGFEDVRAVPEQAAPDGRFPTTAFPNPEEPGTMDLGLAFAAREEAELLLVNDPDADRLSAAVPTPTGRWVVLSGNQIALLLADALLERARREQVLQPLVVASVVSSPSIARLSATRGALFEPTLTGFKWIWAAALELEQLRRGTFVFGCEEALGYSVSSAVRDKDGISAAVALARVAQALRSEDKTLLDRLGELYREVGLWVSVQHSVVRTGSDGARRIAAAVGKLVSDPPAEVGGHEVRSLRDFRDPADRPRWLGAADLVELGLAGGGRVLVRPSGTEPKLKIYVDIEAPFGPADAFSAVEREWQARALALAQAVESKLFTP